MDNLNPNNTTPVPKAIATANPVIHLNGVLRMRVGDADFERKGFKEGKVGLGVVACQHPIHFEEIKVEGENIRQFRINLPVELDGELPVTWAVLKENRTEAE